ncbi:MAG: sel1 repeat family protein [Rhodospirillales bacterium]|nr:sel1 repeat family protein [Rhodospirillales bacterium]
MFRFILLLVLLIGFGGAGSWYIAGQVDKYSGARMSVETRTLLSRAGAGDVEAEYKLGEAYRLGTGFEQDIPQAFKWYARAAEQGHNGARYKLGLIYQTGEGIKQNFGRAANWYRLAANIGHLPEAQFAMGRLYFLGQGVLQDYTEAFSWYEKAARQGHPVAQHLLGAMYEEGWAVERDLIAAYKWYTLAIPGRDAAIAVNRIYDPVRARRYLIKKMNKFQITKGEQYAREWRKTP